MLVSLEVLRGRRIDARPIVSGARFLGMLCSGVCCLCRRFPQDTLLWLLTMGAVVSESENFGGIGMAVRHDVSIAS